VTLLTCSVTLSSLLVHFIVVYDVVFRVSMEKSDKEIMREIQSIMCLIASSITYWMNNSLSVGFTAPFSWIESAPKLISNPRCGLLQIHKVYTLVSYKNDKDSKEE